MLGSGMAHDGCYPEVKQGLHVPITRTLLTYFSLMLASASAQASAMTTSEPQNYSQGEGNTHAPICLSPPTAPRITKCRYVSLICMLCRYLPHLSSLKSFVSGTIYPNVGWLTTVTTPHQTPTRMMRANPASGRVCGLNCRKGTCMSLRHVPVNVVGSFFFLAIPLFLILWPSRIDDYQASTA